MLEEDGVSVPAPVVPIPEGTPAEPARDRPSLRVKTETTVRMEVRRLGPEGDQDSTVDVDPAAVGRFVRGLVLTALLFLTLVGLLVLVVLTRFM